MQFSSNVAHQFASYLNNNPKPQIKVGDTFPGSPCYIFNEEGKVLQLPLPTLIGNRKAIVITVPGPFTPTCHNKHLPPYIARIDQINAIGYEVIVLSTSSPDVMREWKKSIAAEKKIEFIAVDADAPYQMGIGIDKQANRGLGLVFQRGVFILEGGTIRNICLETDPGIVNVTAAETIIRDIIASKL